VFFDFASERFSELQKKSRKHLWAPLNYHGSIRWGFEIVEKFIETQRNDGE
jgi:hypothetical protein